MEILKGKPIFRILPIILACFVFIHFLASNSKDGSTLDNNDSINTSSVRPSGTTMVRYLLPGYQPRHVHLSYGNHPTEMVVTWSTVDDPRSTAVEFGAENVTENRVKGKATLFRDQGTLQLTQYIHRVTLRGLKPGQEYVYHCGGDMGWSPEFKFRVMSNGTNWAPKLAVYGDLGIENAQSLPRLKQDVQRGLYDAIIHVGDMAYNLDTNNGLDGDRFMEMIEPIAAYIPYMTCPGNHEHKYHYKHRFSMPGSHESMMYSWNMGPIHFVSISTEFYYYLQYGVKQALFQYEWLEADLEEANRPANREERPWIIVYGHRPMYCSNARRRDCSKYNTRTRVGIPLLRLYINGLENLFMKYGVDLTLWGHEHSYERMLPLYNYQVYNGSKTDPYKNPKAPVHIITGSAGCWERHSPFRKDIPPWSAFHSTDYGYSRLHVLNKTHLYWEQVSDDKDGRVIDSFFLTREEYNSHKIPSIAEEYPQ